MRLRALFVSAMVLVLVISLIGVLREGVGLAAGSDGAVSGAIIHTLETPAEVAGNPSLASISNEAMSCSVSFGNNLGGAENFGMVVYSEGVDETRIQGHKAIQRGKARSITVQNGQIVESALYDYRVVVRDNAGSGKPDTWAMTLRGEGLLFDAVTFSGPAIAGDFVVEH